MCESYLYNTESYSFHAATGVMFASYCFKCRFPPKANNKFTFNNGVFIHLDCFICCPVALFSSLNQIVKLFLYHSKLADVKSVPPIKPAPIASRDCCPGLAWLGRV